MINSPSKRQTKNEMRSFLVLIGLLLSIISFAQERDKALPKANKEYENKSYQDDEAGYRVSASESSHNAAASYNLGNSIYKQKQYAESKNAYLNAVKSATSRVDKHRAYHNLGNVFMIEKNYTAAVAAYKDALINDPTDEESRYNFALAKKMLKDNPPPKEDKKDKKEDKKKEEDKKKQDQDKKDQDKKDQDKKDQDKKDQDKKDGKDKEDKQKPEEPKEDKSASGISKQRIENMLDAVGNEEKKVQEKMIKGKERGKPVKVEKDW